MAIPVEKYKNKRSNSSVIAFKLRQKTDTHKRVLYVQFKNKAVYKYLETDVGTKVFDNLLTNAKAGEFLGNWISTKKKQEYNGVDFLVYNAGIKIAPNNAKKIGFQI